MKSEKLSLSIREIKAYTPDRLSGVLDNWRKFQYNTIMLAYGESVKRGLEINADIIESLAPLHNVKGCSDMNELLQLFTSEEKYDCYDDLADSLESNLKKADEDSKRKELEETKKKLEDQSRAEKERIKEEEGYENKVVPNNGTSNVGKLNRLSELGELFKSGAISREEFDDLKKEIMTSSAPREIPEEQIVEPSASKEGKEKVSLRSFRDDEGRLQKAPEIEYLKISDISDSERKVLKSFIRKKQIFAPEEMTQDEITIGNKLLTAREIAKANSERSGFNYPFGSIISVLSAGMALFFVWVSPCMLLLGGGTGIGAACIISITTLMKADATKLDRLFSQIALGLCAFSLFVAFTWGGGEGDKLVDCSNSKSEYRSGYETGAAQKLMGSYTGCYQHVQDMNRVTYSNSLKATDCYCAGYSEALVGDPERY